MEIYWGEPMSLTEPAGGSRIRISTIEQAQYWLRRKWPVSDVARQRAIGQLDAAMECMCPVGNARSAFLSAARTAGLAPRVESGVRHDA
ncbi:DUF982 domain-containing protein [Mangrovicoccus ximenensis]|uniref:DUF982 domain-containing protein n=1 Tax=Mangrovicoccus ximenensis TaxID=1911570 RepID=UPI001F1B2D3D|nr:DUF982 domain-containing protein [Mangrovicoccus ximenensis]